jgi:hypothetical protein
MKKLTVAGKGPSTCFKRNYFSTSSQANELKSLPIKYSLFPIYSKCRPRSREITRSTTIWPRIAADAHVVTRRRPAHRQGARAVPATTSPSMRYVASQTPNHVSWSVRVLSWGPWANWEASCPRLASAAANFFFNPDQRACWLAPCWTWPGWKTSTYLATSSSHSCLEGD